MNLGLGPNLIEIELRTPKIPNFKLSSTQHQFSLDEEQKYNFWVSLTICLLYFLKVNHHFNFALGYPWKLQIEFFIIGSDNIFSFVFSHLQNTLAIINNTTSRQFGFKNSQKIFKNATKSLWPLKFFVWSGNFDVFCFQRE